VFHQRIKRDERTQHGQENTEQHGKVARAHASTRTNRVIGCTPREATTDQCEHQAGEKVFLTFDHFVSYIQKQICIELWSWVKASTDVGSTYF
jgi:hypothetical protein